MGDRGRLVILAEVRERWHLAAGSPVVLVEGEDGLVLTTRDAAKRLVREQLAGTRLVDELLEERRTAAAADLA